MLVSWWLVNSGNFDRRYFFKVLCKPANECKLLVHLHPFASTKFKFDSVCMSFIQLHVIQPYSIVFIFSIFGVDALSGTCGCSQRSRQGPIERATKRKRKEPSSRAGKTKSVWVLVCCSSFETDVEIVQHPLLSV